MKTFLMIIALISLLHLPVAFAEDVSVDQLKQMMTKIRGRSHHLYLLTICRKHYHLQQ